VGVKENFQGVLATEFFTTPEVVRGSVSEQRCRRKTSPDSWVSAVTEEEEEGEIFGPLLHRSEGMQKGSTIAFATVLGMRTWMWRWEDWAVKPPLPSVDPSLFWPPGVEPPSPRGSLKVYGPPHLGGVSSQPAAGKPASSPQIRSWTPSPPGGYPRRGSRGGAQKFPKGSRGSREPTHPPPLPLPILKRSLVSGRRGAGGPRSMTVPQERMRTMEISWAVSVHAAASKGRCNVPIGRRCACPGTRKKGPIWDPMSFEEFV